MNVRLRLVTVEDIAQAVRLKDLAGWNQTAADWERFLAASPEGCFAAEYEGRVIGTSATIIYESKLAWIGMVIVDPQHRGRGIGTALMERAIRYLDSREVLCMKLDATPQGAPLYEKFGFVSEYKIERWMLRRRAEGKPAAVAQPLPEDVLALDREMFGVDRSSLLRSLAEAAPELVQMVRKGREVAGYAFGRRGTFADHFGPWMARSQVDAAPLLDEFLQRSGRDLIFADCMGPNLWVLPLVQARGFEFSRPLTRMFRGANQCPGRPELLCATLGPEFG